MVKLKFWGKKGQTRSKTRANKQVWSVNRSQNRRRGRKNKGEEASVNQSAPEENTNVNQVRTENMENLRVSREKNDHPESKNNKKQRPKEGVPRFVRGGG